MDPMSIMRSWPRSPRSVSCAPRSSSNRDPNLSLGPNRSGRSPRPATSTAPAVTGSRFRLWRRPSSMRRWRLIEMRCSPNGSAITTRMSKPQISGRRCPPRVRRLCVWLMRGGTPRRPAARTGSSTTVVVHLDVKERVAALHLGPLLSESDRQYLLCDATCEVWFERDGQVIGSGRATRVINRRLRRALGASPPDVRGAGLWGDPRVACTPHSALGRRRGHRAGQPGAALSRIIIGCTIAAASPSPDPQSS